MLPFSSVSSCSYTYYYNVFWNALFVTILLAGNRSAPWSSALSIISSCQSGVKMKKPFTQDGRMRKGLIVVSKKSSFYDDFEDFNNEDEVEEEDDMSYMTQEDKARLEMFRSQIIMSTSGDTNQLATNDFNEEEEDEDDDDDNNDDEDEEEEEEEFDGSDEGTVQENMASFNSVDDLISFAAGGLQQNKQREWAIPLIDHDSSSNYENTSLQMANAVVKALKSGVILIANPEKFCAPSKNINNNSKKQPSPSLLSKFGLTLPPPSDLGPDRKADLLPVLILLERHPLRGSKAVLLNRRTGYLLGDLEQTSTNTASPPPKLGAFMIQPLWFGGTSASAGTAGGGGLDMLHQCPTVQGCQQLTEDGLFWGGDIMQAQEAMLDCNSLERPMTGFDFKFFVQSTRWLPTQLEREVRDGTWFVASVSKEVLFKPRDRLGTMRAKPLWTEIMELMGGKFLNIRNLLYDE